MTLLSMLSAAAGPSHLNPVKLFADADIVVKVVMSGLILSSIWVWMIIVSFSLRMGAVRRRSDDYEREFWKSQDISALQTDKDLRDVPPARITKAALDEWKLSTASNRRLDRAATRDRLAATMDSAAAAEADALSDRLNFLATVGAVAPFVGLFGTVWGIMNSFFQIGQHQDSSLATVAPGISEALFATAIGLFAAIPAVIAYNRFSHRVNQYEARLQRFAERVHASFSREMESD
jgi:biopolymer transport protein TolQ